MPVFEPLPDPIVKQFYLPSTAKLPEDQQAWVKMDVSPMNVRDHLLVQIGDTPSAVSIRILAARIRDWNVLEVDQTPLPINTDSILRLGQANLNYLAAQIPTEATSTLDLDQKKS